MTSFFPACQASCELVFPLVVPTPKSLEFSLRLISRFVAGRGKTYRHTPESGSLPILNIVSPVSNIPHLSNVDTDLHMPSDMNFVLTSFH